MARYTHFSAAVSVGKWPRALTALQIRALMDSMVIWSPWALRGGELGFCGLDGVFDAACAVIFGRVSKGRSLWNRDVVSWVGIVVAELAEGLGELAA